MTDAVAHALAMECVRRKDERFPVDIDLMGAFQLIAALQLACRHPSFRGPTRAHIEGFARILQARITEPGTAMADVLEQGWNPDLDVPTS